MKFSRRQFLGLIAASGAASCARVRELNPIAGLGGDKDEFAFAAVGDLHVRDARSTAIVNRAVADMNARTDLEFVLVLGDLATDGRLPELNLAKASLDRLNHPYFIVPGNHDVDPTLADEYGNLQTVYDWKNWQRADSGWVFLGLDSCTGTASDVAIRPEQIEWLEKQLNRINPARPIVLCSHHPFNPNTRAYRVQNADDVIGMFAQHNLRLVAAGHYHGNQVEERDGVLYTTTACCSTTRDNFDGTEARGYRIFRVNHEELTTEFVEVLV